jgi:outer membrane protein assembly factor BamA
MSVKAALRAATIALFATAASVATPARIGAQDISCEPGDLEVRELDFRGNRALADDDLALRITTTPSSWGRRKLNLWFSAKRCLNRSELGRDLLRLKGYYRDRGFYSAQVDTVVEPMAREAVRVIFNIAEGEPVLLASYTVTGLDSVPEGEDIRRRLRLQVGKPFDFIMYGADMDTIVRRLRNAGYYRASTVPGYDWDTAGVARADAFITVLPGKRARFGAPQFKIAPVTPERGQQIGDSVVFRVLRIRPGDVFSDRAIVEAQRNLFQLNTYQHIDVTALPDSLQPPGDTIVRLLVTLTEDYMHQLDSEYGWATLDCGRVRLQYTDKNFLKTARRFELTAQASKIGFGRPLATPFTRDLCTPGQLSPLDEDPFSLKLYYFTGFTVRQPRLLGTRWVPTLSVYSERRGEFKAYLRSTQVGADLSATRDLGDRMPLRLAYTFEYGRTEADPPALCVLFNRCDPDSRRQIQQLLPLGIASAAFVRVRTDDAVRPSRGHLLRTEVRTSASRLLGTSDTLFFNKGTGDAAWYRRLGWSNVLALRVRGGIVLGDSSGFIPPQERLYGGGPTSVRGFQQNELGPLVYIARTSTIDSTVISAAGTDTLQYSVTSDTSRLQGPERSVPLGGNMLFVANIEYRIRDPFFFPDRLEYTLFLDGGDVWSRGRSHRISWTPGLGIRAITPVGPVQVNIGYNSYPREKGSIYYNPNVLTLACATPGNTLKYTRPTAGGQLTPVNDAEPCRGDYSPPGRDRWRQKLTFTFSITSDF